jgi:hypothetical protein
MYCHGASVRYMEALHHSLRSINILSEQYRLCIGVVKGVLTPRTWVLDSNILWVFVMVLAQE